MSGYANRALDGAYRRGMEAAREGRPRVPPYPDHRTRTGRVTFSRAFRRAWLEGYDAVSGGETAAVGPRKEDRIT